MWLPQVTSVMVVPALAIALMMLVAAVAVLHCIVLPWLLEGKEKGKNNERDKPYVETNNNEWGKERDTSM